MLTENHQKDEQTHLNEVDFLKKVEEAAYRGVLRATKPKRNFLKIFHIFKLIQPTIAIITFVILVSALLYIKGAWGSFMTKLSDFTKFDFATNHDQILKNNGLFGFQAVDYADVILSNQKDLKLLEVYEVTLTDAVTITDAGLLGWKIFEKSQIVTYNGTAIYVVDLSQLSKKDIIVDRENKKVILDIPNATMRAINIDEREIQFADVERGLMAFGQMKLTLERVKEMQEFLRSKMEEKLVERNEAEKANQFAEKAVWEIFQPLISKSNQGYTLEVK